jgi:hypothetical protein
MEKGVRHLPHPEHAPERRDKPKEHSWIQSLPASLPGRQPGLELHDRRALLFTAASHRTPFAPHIAVYLQPGFSQSNKLTIIIYIRFCPYCLKLIRVLFFNKYDTIFYYFGIAHIGEQ